MNQSPPIKYEDLNERERQVQASIWALSFLLSELASGIIMLRRALITKGIITEEEDLSIAESISDPTNLNLMYRNTEMAFMEKYHKIRFAMENPGAVEQEMKERMNNEKSES